jgi:type IV pilus assembly protein PilC
MPVFQYEVADRKGSVSSGTAEAAEQAELITRFRERGQIVLSLRPARSDAGGGGALGGFNAGVLAGNLRQSFKRMATGVNLGTVLLFTGQLAAMLGGGLHLVRILTALAAESTHKVFTKVLESVRDDITSGGTFADALAHHPHVFNTLYVSIVRAGELSGSLPIVLDTLTTYLEKTDAIRRKVKGAIAYPAVILVVAILIVIFMILKIVPIFKNVYDKAGAVLPLPTRILIAFSNALRDYLLFMLLGLAFVVLVVYSIYQSPGGRRFFDRMKLQVPLFGSLIRKGILARTCRTLSVLLNAGIPLIEAMETVARVSGNAIIEDALTKATQRMRDGGTIADTLRETGEFPGMVTQLVATGEESGTLPTMLGRAATYYEQQVDQAVSTLSSLIEPIMIVVMGGIAGGVIFALYLPIFNLGQAMKGGVK